MSKTVKLHTYTAILSFRSKKLGKTFKAGDQIKAPMSLGSDWVSDKVATKNPNPKQNTP